VHLKSRTVLATAAATVIATTGIAMAPPAAAAVTANAAAPTIIRTACPGGIWAITTKPAAGFNPLTATSAQLAANNYAASPAKTDTTAYAQWKKFVLSPSALTSACPSTTSNGRSSGGGALRTAVSPDGLTGYAAQTNWSGYMAHGALYTEAEASWGLPGVIGAVAGTNEYSSTWVGIGLGQSSTNQLFQAGSESDYVNGKQQNYLWFELVPLEGQKVMTYAVKPGDSVGAHVAYTSNGPMFHVWDTTARYNDTVLVTGSWGDDGHAEWIYERTQINNKFPYLAEAPATFTAVQALTGGSWKTLSAMSDVAITMYNCPGNTVLAYPEGIQGTSTFTEHWANHGDNNAC
jgi:Peptidase A4 family